MKHYLSFGGGVNSVALHLLMLEEGYDFEAVFVNHGCDWPETYEYFEYFQEWLSCEGLRPVTVICPEIKRGDRFWNDMFEFCIEREIIPQQYPRWCTGDFKRKPYEKYIEKPCFTHIGIDYGERKRAALKSGKDENRFLLIEHEIDRNGCKNIIKRHGLKIPMKSGCYFCPFQKVGQWKNLRALHPCLFQNAVNMEKNSGRTFLKTNLPAMISESQMPLFEQDEYPPCECGL